VEGWDVGGRGVVDGEEDALVCGQVFEGCGSGHGGLLFFVAFVSRASLAQYHRRSTMKVCIRKGVVGFVGFRGGCCVVLVGTKANGFNMTWGSPPDSRPRSCKQIFRDFIFKLPRITTLNHSLEMIVIDWKTPSRLHEAI
jgi:hypothetical protein